MEKEFSDYIVYVDESGDHSMVSIDHDYPLFILAFCIFRKDSYIENVVPALQSFKFKYYGHDMVVLHELDIRKSRGPFNTLLDKKVRDPFMEDLNCLIDDAPFTLITSVIDKQVHLDRYGHNAHSPYDLSLLFCMERLQYFFTAQGETDRQVHIVLEKRGKKEDDELELVFRRFCDTRQFPFEPVFAHKQNNSAGLQVADLVARPIGRHIIKPDQQNRAYNILKKKFYRGPNGSGLKIFPVQET
jgi:hypothetical protein